MRFIFLFCNSSNVKIPMRIRRTISNEIIYFGILNDFLGDGLVVVSDSVVDCLDAAGLVSAFVTLKLNFADPTV